MGEGTAELAITPDALNVQLSDNFSEQEDKIINKFAKRIIKRTLKNAGENNTELDVKIGPLGIYSSAVPAGFLNKNNVVELYERVSEAYADKNMGIEIHEIPLKEESLFRKNTIVVADIDGQKLPIDSRFSASTKIFPLNN